MALKHSPTEAEIKQIIDLYHAGRLFKEIRDRTGWCYTTIKKVVVAHGLTRKKPRKVAPTSEINDAELLAFKAIWDKLDSTVKGTISENYAKTRLSELGFDVWEPVCQNHKTDLILLSKQDIKRLQAKSGTYDPKTKCFRVNFSRRRRGGKRSEYDPDSVDFFIVHCAGIAKSLYVIPAISVKNKSPRLFPHRPKLLAYCDTEMEQYLDAFRLLGSPYSY